MKMRYDVDLGKEERGSLKSPLLDDWKERAVEVLSSTPFLVLLLLAILGAVGFFGVYETLSRGSPPQRSRLLHSQRALEDLQQQRSRLMSEGEAALRIGLEAKMWSSLLRAVGEPVPAGFWLTRVALEAEEEPKRVLGRRAGSTEGGIKETASAGRYLEVEGGIDLGEVPDPLASLSKYLSMLRNDPHLGSVVKDLRLISTEVSEEDPSVLAFRIRGEWAERDVRALLEAKMKERKVR